MNNYFTFLTNFISEQNFGIFYISHKFNELFDEKSNRIVSWKYIGRIKLPEKFIIKYHTKIKKMVLYDYSEDFFKNHLFYFNVKISSNIDYSIFKKYSEEFMIFLLMNTIKFNLSSKKIISNYPFTYKTFEKYNLYNIAIEDNNENNYVISNFDNNDIKKTIKNLSKMNTDDRLELNQRLKLLKIILKNKKINKQVRKKLILNHNYFGENFLFYRDLLKFQYLTPAEIKLMKKLLEEKSNYYTNLLKTKYF